MSEEISEALYWYNGKRYPSFILIDVIMGFENNLETI